jgi:glycosyltransferase involved in cell wall biosynthesis
MPRPPLVIAHDYLTQRGGAEKVVLALTRGFPEAPIQTTLYEPADTYPEFGDVEIRVTGLNRFRWLRRHHRHALPLLARAVARTTIDADVTLASSSAWAHGFRTTGRKVVYCYSPARWLYQPGAYLGEHAGWPMRVALAILAPGLRRWDRRHARTAHRYIAVSRAVQQRIRDAYGIEADVVHPPHTYRAEGEQAMPAAAPHALAAGGFALCISRLLPYKNVGAVVDAFRGLEHPLVIVGVGPEEARLRLRASANVVFLQQLTDAEMRWLYARCSELIAASFEDFGLTPIEAAAFGKPAVTLRWGGFLDSIVEGTTGLHFDAPTAEAIADAVRRARARTWDADAIRVHALAFSEEGFIERISGILAEQAGALRRRE